MDFLAEPSTLQGRSWRLRTENVMKLQPKRHVCSLNKLNQLLRLAMLFLLFSSQVVAVNEAIGKTSEVLFLWDSSIHCLFAYSLVFDYCFSHLERFNVRRHITCSCTALETISVMAATI
jgi:hypothetical protein